MIEIFNSPELAQLEKILKDKQLPTDDLPMVDRTHFFGCGNAASPSGVIGMEVYESVAMVRSLAVAARHQSNGYGSALLQHLETHARSIGVTALYLLTETAEAFFQQKGYQVIGRELAPEAITQTAQFSSLCPDSAVLMHKSLD